MGLFHSDNHSKIPTKFSMKFFFNVFVFEFQIKKIKKKKKLRLTGSDYEKLASYIRE